MGKNIINRPGEHVELENSLCVTGHLLPTPAQKDFATEPELFWRVQVNPTQGQAASSEPFPHTVHFPKPAFPIPGQCRAGRSCPPAQAPPAWAGSTGLRTLQSKSLSVPWTLHLPWGFSSVFSKKKKSHHKLSEAFFSDRDERLNEVSSGSGDVWLKSISSSSGGKSESRAYKGKTYLIYIISIISSISNVHYTGYTLLAGVWMSAVL